MNATLIRAIDPGPEQSAWLDYDRVTDRVAAFEISTNDELLWMLRQRSSYGRVPGIDVVVIEQIRSYGMSVGAEVFDTVHWSGRFTEAAAPTPVVQLPRIKVKQAICHDSRAKDSNIRQALIDRFGGATAIGVKARPGPLYGISKDVWSALAIAVTYAETEAIGGGPGR